MVLYLEKTLIIIIYFSNTCKLIWEYGFEVYWRVAHHNRL